MDEGVGENSEGSGEEEGSGGDEESGAEVRRRRKRQSSTTEIGSEQEFRMEPSSLMTVLDTPLCLEEGKRYEIKLIFDQVWPLTLFLLFPFLKKKNNDLPGHSRRILTRERVRDSLSVFFPRNHSTRTDQFASK